MYVVPGENCTWRAAIVWWVPARSSALRTGSLDTEFRPAAASHISNSKRDLRSYRQHPEWGPTTSLIEKEWGPTTSPIESE